MHKLQKNPNNQLVITLMDGMFDGIEITIEEMLWEESTDKLSVKYNSLNKPEVLTEHRERIDIMVHNIVKDYIKVQVKRK